MAQINAYLTFNGNCREAMNFYQECFGGELYLQTIGESPLADKMPPDMKDGILHANLRSEALVLLASDMVSEKGFLIGNNVSLMLECASETEIRAAYEKLAAGGNATHPIENTFWGALFGGLTDQFGNNWLLHFDQNAVS